MRCPLRDTAFEARRMKLTDLARQTNKALLAEQLLALVELPGVKCHPGKVAEL